MCKKVSIIVAVISVIMIIGSVIFLSAAFKKPAVFNSVESVLKGCEQLSSNKITNSYDSPDWLDFKRCVTINDYLSECGFELSFFDEDTMKINNVRILGAYEDESDESYGSDAKSTVVYIAVDYTDENNNSCTCAESFNVISTDKGKIRYIY